LTPAPVFPDNSRTPTLVDSRSGYQFATTWSRRSTAAFLPSRRGATCSTSTVSSMPECPGAARELGFTCWSRSEAKGWQEREVGRQACSQSALAKALRIRLLPSSITKVGSGLRRRVTVGCMARAQGLIVLGLVCSSTCQRSLARPEEPACDSHLCHGSPTADKNSPG